jgi:hypothetical protein
MYRQRCFLTLAREPAPANKKRIWYSVRRMARRPDPAEFDRPLTDAELKQRRRELSMLSPQHVAESFRTCARSLPHGGRSDPAGERGSGTGGCMEIALVLAEANQATGTWIGEH